MDPVIIWPDPKPCPEDVTSSGSMLGIHRFIRSRNTCFPTEACIHRLLSKTNNLCVLGQVFWTASKVYGAVIMCVCTMWNSWSFHQYWFIIWFSFINNRKPYYVSWHFHLILDWLEQKFYQWLIYGRKWQILNDEEICPSCLVPIYTVGSKVTIVFTLCIYVRYVY